MGRRLRDRPIVAAVVTFLGSALVGMVAVLPDTPTASQRFWNGLISGAAGVGLLAFLFFTYSLVYAATNDQRIALIERVRELEGTGEAGPTRFFDCELLQAWMPAPQVEIALTCLVTDARVKVAVQIPGFEQSGVMLRSPRRPRDDSAGCWPVFEDSDFEVELRQRERWTLRLGGVLAGELIRAVDLDEPTTVMLMVAGHGTQDEQLWIRSAPLGMYQIRFGESDWPERPDDWANQVLALLNRVNATRTALAGYQSHDEVRQSLDGLIAHLDKSPIVGKSFTADVSAVRSRFTKTPFAEVQASAVALVDGWRDSLRAAARGRV